MLNKVKEIAFVNLSITMYHLVDVTKVSLGRASSSLEAQCTLNAVNIAEDEDDRTSANADPRIEPPYQQRPVQDCPPTKHRKLHFVLDTENSNETRESRTHYFTISTDKMGHTRFSIHQIRLPWNSLYQSRKNKKEITRVKVTNQHRTNTKS
ncbi:hypothetical protein M0804_004513 [Polistes exclamans]|nr:hypothetical protein M0804_004513 [Polistes exclamans]